MQNDASVNSDTKEATLLMLRLWVLNTIYADIGTWLEVEYFNSHQVQLIREAIAVTCLKFKRHAVAYTYSFNPSEDVLDSMIAPSDGNLYKSIVQRTYSSPNAFDRIGNWRELYGAHK